MPLTDIIFGGEEGPGSGIAAPMVVQPAPAGAGVTLIAFGAVPPPDPGTDFALGAAVVDTNVFGYLDQFGFIFGTFSPLSINGATLGGMYVDTPATPAQGTYIAFFGNHAQDLFTSVEINGTTLLSADAVFTLNTAPIVAPNSLWFWPAEIPYNAVGNYSGTFV